MPLPYPGLCPFHTRDYAPSEVSAPEGIRTVGLLIDGGPTVANVRKSLVRDGNMKAS
jgi:hypothetical protein